MTSSRPGAFTALVKYIRNNVSNAKTVRKKCIHCGQLILRKISKIGATRCQILRLKCTKFDLYLRGATSKGREGKGDRK